MSSTSADRVSMLITHCNGVAEIQAQRDSSGEHPPFFCDCSRS